MVHFSRLEKNKIGNPFPFFPSIFSLPVFSLSPCLCHISFRELFGLFFFFSPLCLLASYSISSTHDVKNDQVEDRNVETSKVGGVEEEWEGGRVKGRKGGRMEG